MKLQRNTLLIKKVKIMRKGSGILGIRWEVLFLGIFTKVRGRKKGK